MELVYLWVEDYKNIKNQGFNFSPRFECSYDEKNQSLTIDEKDDYLENFFGENINITAIVGENGSGKSSIFKLIMQLIAFKTFDNISLNNEKNEKSFLIIYNFKKFQKISIKDDIKKIIYNKSLIVINSLHSSNNIDFFTVHFNYMLDTFYDDKDDKWIKNIYHKADSYKTPLLLEPYKNNNEKQQIDLDIIEYLNNHNMLRFYSKFDINKNLFEFFKPNKIIFKIANKKYINILKQVQPKGKKDISKEYRSIFYKFIQLYEKKQFPKMGKNKAKLSSIYRRITNLYKNQQYKDISYLYIALKVLSSRQILFNKDEYRIINNWAKTVESGQELLSFKESLTLNNLISNKASLYEVRKIQICINFIENKIYNLKAFTDNINNITNISVIKDILDFLPPWLDIEWFENSKSIKSLSSGEKTFFTFLINLMYQIQNINDDSQYQTINIFLDETELGLHPNWQKQYISKILNALKQINNKKINLIFATHSPFILSDLPKENVIFLENAEQKYPNIDSFGANIHTLLSHGFFMKDGLMGDFAKNKIQKIQKFYEKVKKYKKNKKVKKAYLCFYKKKQKEFKQIQEIIGEPFLKTVIENYLDEMEEILFESKAKENEMKRVVEKLGKKDLQIYLESLDND